VAKSRRYRLGPVTFDAESHTLRYGGKERRLGPKSSRTLEVLVEASLEDSRRFLDRASLTVKVWGGHVVERNNLDIIIRKLRTILNTCDPAAKSPKGRRPRQEERGAQRHIEAIHGAGFKYIGPAERLPPDKLVIAAREPKKKNPDDHDALAVVRDVSNGIPGRARERLGTVFVVKPTDDARYNMWFDEERELNADYVLNLEAWKHGGFWRASAQVLNESERSLKSSKEFKAKDYLRLRDEIIDWVVGSLDEGGDNE